MQYSPPESKAIHSKNKSNLVSLKKQASKRTNKKPPPFFGCNNLLKYIITFGRRTGMENSSPTGDSLKKLETLETSGL